MVDLSLLRDTELFADLDDIALDLIAAASMPRELRRGDVVFAEGAQPEHLYVCLLYTSPSPRDGLLSRMPSSA